MSGTRRRRADEVLRRLDLHRLRRQRADSLTLPDRKRLEVARALATEPKLLLLDEVMAGLRPTETDRMVAILTELNRASGLTIVLIEHVMRAVMALATRRARAASRRGHRAGRPAEVVHDPRGDQVLSRRGGSLMLAVEGLDVFYGDAQALDSVSSRSRRGRSSRSSAPMVRARQR